MKRFKTFAAVVLGLGAACGGDDEGEGRVGSASVDTGLPEAQLLSEATPAERTNACDSIQAAVDTRFSDERVTRLGCELSSALFSEDQTTCRDLADDCEANPPETDAEIMDFAEGAELGCAEPTALEGCEVTAGELEACLNDTFSVIEAVITLFGCSNAGNIDLEVMDPQSPFGATPPSCARLEADCPQLLANEEPR